MLDNLEVTKKFNNPEGVLVVGTWYKRFECDITVRSGSISLLSCYVRSYF